MDRYAVRPLDLTTDGAAFAALLARNISGLDPNAAEQKAQRAYLDNPEGHGQAFALEAADAPGVAGALCLQNRRWHHARSAFAVACLADFSVDADHRSLGPALRLVRHAVEACPTPVLYGFPNRLARGLVARAGLRSMGRMSRFGKPLSLRALGRGPRATRGRRLLAGLHGLADPLLRLWDAGLAWRRGLGWRASEAAFGEPWLDAPWTARNAALLLSTRDARTVAWRYASDLKHDWRLARVDDRLGRPMGHVVWRLADGIAEIGDLHGRDLPKGLTPLLLAFAPFARRHGALALSIECLSSAAALTAIRHAGFLPYASGDEVLGRWPDDFAWPEAAFLTGFDRDTH